MQQKSQSKVILSPDDELNMGRKMPVGIGGCAMLRCAGYRNWFLPEIIGVRPWAIGFAQFELPIYFFSVWLCYDNLIIVVPRGAPSWGYIVQRKLSNIITWGASEKKNAFRWWWSWRRIFTPLGAFLRKKRPLWSSELQMCVSIDIIVLRVLWAFFAPEYMGILIKNWNCSRL